jgi:dTDP-4-amino-4,6-dideoxygalactose transaminase
MPVPLSQPPVAPHALDRVRAAVESGRLGGGGHFTRLCEDWLQARLGCQRALLTGSASQALHMAALLLELRPGDEVIMPSWTFPSTANAVLLVGAQPVFADVDPETLNLDPDAVAAKISSRTRAICVVHYAGVAADMDALLSLARHHGLAIIEDAAQGLLANHREVPLGTLGDIGVLSFHSTKNVGAGEAGALLINRPDLVPRAECLREKGTDRMDFERKAVAHYQWCAPSPGGGPSELVSAFLSAQLDYAQQWHDARLAAWNSYHQLLTGTHDGYRLMTVPPYAAHNAHQFAIRTSDSRARSRLQQTLSAAGITAAPHYVPLHQSPLGRQYHDGQALPCTERAAASLLRLPLWPDMPEDVIRKVCALVSVRED